MFCLLYIFGLNIHVNFVSFWVHYNILEIYVLVLLTTIYLKPERKEFVNLLNKVNTMLN